MADQGLVTVGIALVFVGFGLVAMILLSSHRGSGAKSRGEAVLIIGPFPIIFGSDEKSAQALLVLAIILTILLTTFFLVSH